MSLRLVIVSSLATLVLSAGCDSPPAPAAAQQNGTETGTTVDTTPKSAQIISTVSDIPPGAVDMTPPTQADADAFEQAKLIMHGMNVGNFLDQPGSQPADPTTSQCGGITPLEGQATGSVLRGWMFEAIARAGFDHVRISINWNCHTHAKDANLYQIDDVWLKRIDTVVAHVLTRNMAAIVDMHFDWDYINDLPGARDQFISIWTQLSDHFKDYPKQLFFELLNEPTNISDSKLGADYATVIQIVRQTNPYRTIIYDGNSWAKASELPSLSQYLPSDDHNLIGTDHFYNPYCFTTPDQTWDCPLDHRARYQDVQWPILFPSDYAGDAGDTDAQESEALVKSHFDSVAAISKQIGRPIYLGEFGADRIRNVKSRAAYLSSVTRNAERNGIGWGNWSFTATYDAWRGTIGWYPEIIKALRPDYIVPADL